MPTRKPENAHTKGPWKFDVGNWQIEVEGSRTAIADLCTGPDEDTGELPDAFANGHRIVACVNALEGIENPAAIRDLIAACQQALNVPPKQLYQAGVEVEQVWKALAALTQSSRKPEKK